jgi:hypothetical protein
MEHFVKVVFRKPFEALHYVPEIKAKYRALKKEGFVDRIELAMGVDDSEVRKSSF